MPLEGLTTLVSDGTGCLVATAKVQVMIVVGVF